LTKFWNQTIAQGVAMSIALGAGAADMNADVYVKGRDCERKLASGGNVTGHLSLRRIVSYL
jgi:hypothetical protein